MNIILVQLDIAWEDKAANLSTVRQWVADAKPEKDSLIVLPEMFSTGFSMNVKATAQNEAREEEAFMSQMAKQYESTVLGGVVSPVDDGQARNEAVAFGPQGQLLARYAKIQLFSSADEANTYTAGSEIVNFPWCGFDVTPFICYDLRFPEHFREAVRRGTQVFVVIACWPAKRHLHWFTLVQARAIENQAFVIAVNRCGSDPQFLYNGGSMIVSPKGHLVAEAGNKPGIVKAQIQPEEVIEWRKQFPALKDMRPVIHDPSPEDS